MMPLIADRKAAFIIMHMQGEPRTMQLAPRYVDVVSEVAEFFSTTICARHRVRR